MDWSRFSGSNDSNADVDDADEVIDVYGRVWRYLDRDGDWWVRESDQGPQELSWDTLVDAYGPLTAADDAEP